LLNLAFDGEPFGPLDGATRRALREEADRLADFHR
jgi:ABC-type nitrate/sulfonate/bicarbonate transport system ATPase subunit